MIVPISDLAALKNVILTQCAPNAPKFFPRHRKWVFQAEGVRQTWLMALRQYDAVILTFWWVLNTFFRAYGFFLVFSGFHWFLLCFGPYIIKIN